jgi:hypothetical protein
MKKTLLITLLGASLALAGCAQQIISENQNIDLTNTITPSEAYLVCNSKSCPTDTVTIQGELKRGGTTHGVFELQDDKKNVVVLLHKSSLYDTLIFEEENYLLEGGVVEAIIKGKIHSEDYKGPVVIMEFESENFKFIKKIQCNGENDCFDLTSYRMKASDAYQKLVNSKICTQDDRKTTGYVSYSKITGVWQFQTDSNSDPGGCSTYCSISPSETILSRQCTHQENNLRLQE